MGECGDKTVKVLLKLFQKLVGAGVVASSPPQRRYAPRGAFFLPKDFDK